MDRLQPCRAHWGWAAQAQLPLKVGGYRVEALVEATKSHGLSLSEQEAIDAREKLKYALIEGLHSLYESDQEEHRRHICECVVLIDQYFLGGQLTQVHRYANNNGMYHLKICIEDGNQRCEYEGTYSHFSVDFRDGGDGGVETHPFVRIDIDSAEGRPIAEIVKILIHEMVHGYLELFSCSGGFSAGPSSGCSHDPHRGCRHGRHARELLEHVFLEIQDWDDDVLRDFGDEYINNCNHRLGTDPGATLGFLRRVLNDPFRFV